MWSKPCKNLLKSRKRICRNCSVPFRVISERDKNSVARHIDPQRETIPECQPVVDGHRVWSVYSAFHPVPPGHTRWPFISPAASKADLQPYTVHESRRLSTTDSCCYLLITRPLSGPPTYFDHRRRLHVGSSTTIFTVLVRWNVLIFFLKFCIVLSATKCTEDVYNKLSLLYTSSANVA